VGFVAGGAAVADPFRNNQPDDDATAEGKSGEQKDQSQSSVCLIHPAKINKNASFVIH